MDLYENTPIRFDATVNAGKVHLPQTQTALPVSKSATSSPRSPLPGGSSSIPIMKAGQGLRQRLRAASLSGEAGSSNKLSGGTFD